MKFTVYLIGSIYIVLSFLSCSSIGKSQQNYAFLYKSSGQMVDPDYIIYHDELDSSKVFFKMESDKILYTRKSKADYFSGKIVFHFEILKDISSKEILDSGSFFIHDRVEEVEDKVIYGDFSFKAKIGDVGLMKIFCADQNRNSIVEKHVNFNKSSLVNKQFFILKNENKKPIFSNYIDSSEVLNLESNLNRGKTLFLRNYSRTFPISPPPFTSSSNKSFDYSPESRSELSLDEFGRCELSLPSSGFSHIQLDTTTRNGVSLFVFNPYFPEVKSVQQMIPPVRYICSRSEYNKLISSDFEKSAIDYFWRDKTGSKDRAREIIRKYYGRVENSNEHFTSYIEGWKTDRGMISMIYGPPSIVSKLNNREIWVYGDENNINSLSFVFTKMNNPFTENDYKLERSPMYKSSWYKAVDAWRSGRAYWIQ